MQSVNTSPSKPVVFVVDESAGFRHLLRRKFEEFLPEYELRLLESGPALLNAFIADEQTGLVMISTPLQVMNSLDLVKLLRHQTRWRYVPVIFMSEQAHSSEVTACYEAGINSFVIKPVDVADMCKRLKVICNYWFTIHYQSAIHT